MKKKKLENTFDEFSGVLFFRDSKNYVKQIAEVAAKDNDVELFKNAFGALSKKTQGELIDSLIENENVSFLIKLVADDRENESFAKAIEYIDSALRLDATEIYRLGKSNFEAYNEYVNSLVASTTSFLNGRGLMPDFDNTNGADELNSSHSGINTAFDEFKKHYDKDLLLKIDIAYENIYSATIDLCEFISKNGSIIEAAGVIMSALNLGGSLTNFKNTSSKYQTKLSALQTSLG